MNTPRADWDGRMIGLMEARALRDGLGKEMADESPASKALLERMAWQGGGNTQVWRRLKEELGSLGEWVDEYDKLCRICASLEREEIAMLVASNRQPATLRQAQGRPTNLQPTR